MKRIIAVLVLVLVMNGCNGGGTKPKTIMPGPHRTPEEECAEGFMEGYLGARPLDPHLRDKHDRSGAAARSQGRSDGYITGRGDEMQQR
jgi:hypothetical protein